MALSDEQKQVVEQEFDRMINEALAGFQQEKPTLAQFNGDVAQYSAADKKYKNDLAAFNSNPLAGAINGIQQEVEDQRKAGASEDALEQLATERLTTLKQNIMDGVDNDLVNVQSRQAAQEQLMSSALRFPPDLIGIVKSLVQMMSGTNEWMDAANQTVAQAMQGNFDDPAAALMAAKENSFLSSGLASGLIGAGVSVDGNTQSYIASTVASRAAPATSNESPSGPSGEKQEGPQGEQEVYSAPNGAIPPAPPPTRATSATASRSPQVGG